MIAASAQVRRTVWCSQKMVTVRVVQLECGTLCTVSCAAGTRHNGNTDLALASIGPFLFLSFSFHIFSLLFLHISFCPLFVFAISSPLRIRPWLSRRNFCAVEDEGRQAT